MRGWGGRILVAVLALIVVEQFIPVDRASPAEDPAQTVYATIPVPPDVAGTLRRACHDCHSSQTVWPACCSPVPLGRWRRAILGSDGATRRAGPTFRELSTTHAS